MLYVTDCRAHVLVEISDVERAARWRTISPPWPAGDLRDPAGVALAADGRLVVVDRGHHRLVVLSPDRRQASSLGPDGTTVRSLWQPTAVAIGPAGEILVADTGNRRIVRCDGLDGGSWSAYGQGPDDWHFVAPTGVAFDAAAGIVIADPGAGHVVRIASFAGGGATAVALPPTEATPRPYGVAPGLGGTLVADPATSRLLLLAADGAGAETATVLVDGRLDGSLLAPTAAVELAGSLLVADPAGASVARFDRPADEGGGWQLAARLHGERGAFESPTFPRIGGFTAGGAA